MPGTLHITHGDSVALNGINRWLGGVHLRDNEVWRWDEVGRNIVRE